MADLVSDEEKRLSQARARPESKPKRRRAASGNLGPERAEGGVETLPLKEK